MRRAEKRKGINLTQNVFTTIDGFMFEWDIIISGIFVTGWTLFGWLFSLILTNNRVGLSMTIWLGPIFSYFVLRYITHKLTNIKRRKLSDSEEQDREYEMSAPFSYRV